MGSQAHSAKSGSGGPNIALIATVAILAYLVILFAKNNQGVQINFLVYHKTMTMRWLIIVCIVLGVLADRLFSLWWGRRSDRKNNNKNNDNKNNNNVAETD